MPDARPNFSLRLGGGGPGGEARLKLLEAIDRLGSISAAAGELGLSYRGAWDAVQALNNVFARPLVAASSGGRTGGGAGLTSEGRAALRALRHLQEEIALTLSRLHRKLADEPQAAALLETWSLVMRTSARNALRGTIAEVIHGAVDSEVTLTIAPGVDIVAIISRRSAEDLGLAAGQDAIALIKASFIILAPGAEPPRTSARNALAGVVVQVEEGAVNTEVIVELGQSKTLAAIVTRQSARELDLKPGSPVTALIKAPHVILALD